MDQVRTRTCEMRFELRLTREQHRKLGWLGARLNRSGNAIVRMLIDRAYADEHREMLIQAGFPDGKLP